MNKIDFNIIIGDRSIYIYWMSSSKQKLRKSKCFQISAQHPVHVSILVKLVVNLCEKVGILDVLTFMLTQFSYPYEWVGDISKLEHRGLIATVSVLFYSEAIQC